MNQTKVSVQFTSSLPKIVANFESASSTTTFTTAAFTTAAVPPAVIAEVGRFFIGPKGDRGVQGEKGDPGEGLDNFNLDLLSIYELSRG